MTSDSSTLESQNRIQYTSVRSTNPMIIVIILIVQCAQESTMKSGGCCSSLPPCTQSILSSIFSVHARPYACIYCTTTVSFYTKYTHNGTVADSFDYPCLVFFSFVLFLVQFFCSHLPPTHFCCQVATILGVSLFTLLL